MSKRRCEIAWNFEHEIDLLRDNPWVIVLGHSGVQRLHWLIRRMSRHRRCCPVCGSWVCVGSGEECDE